MRCDGADVTVHEETLSIPKGAERLTGIVSRPSDRPSHNVGVLIVVGGPQYRVGSHRQFVQLARRLASEGFEVLRFDVQGMGDSSGDPRGFEHLTADLHAAMNALLLARPGLQRVVLWGLCDGASASLLFAHEERDARLGGLCLLNPWVRSEASLARTHVKHYYLHRVREREFWRKLLNGGMSWRNAVDFGRNAWLARRAAHPRSGVGDATFRHRMALGWAAHRGPLLLILSADDITAQEFAQALRDDRSWRRAAAHPSLERMDLPDADHTLSTASARLAMEDRVVRWLNERVLPAAGKIDGTRPGAGVQSNGPTAETTLIQRPSAALTAPLRRPVLLPRTPILGWPDLLAGHRTATPAFDGLPHRRHTTSGRAALAAALAQASQPAGIEVLVASYHCPTMVAPIVRAGLIPRYFSIGRDGLPLLEAMPSTSQRARVMIVAHYFGLARSLRLVREWCDQRGVVLIEDCAHCFFGRAGERDVGHWGDFAIASLAKFFPMAEGGMLASATRRLKPHPFAPAPLRTQLKAMIDVVELAHRHRHLAGITHLAAPLLWVKNRHRAQDATTPTGDLDAPPAGEAAMLLECDMARTGQEPAWVVRVLSRVVQRARCIERRRANYTLLAETLGPLPGSWLPTPRLPDDAVPYACPLVVDDPQRADAVYAALRRARLPVFRWDRCWPGTPMMAGDEGPKWSRQLLQLLCHQSLNREHMPRFVQTLHDILRSH